MDRLEIIKTCIDRLLTEKDHILVAIDGKCTSGKTTLATRLADHYDCTLLHMDDFFLRPEQRTPERYAQPGGNVDYERFYEEVLLPLKKGVSFSFRPFHCKTLTLSDPVFVPKKPLTVIEGSYSLHPYLGDPYDLKILLTVTEEAQQERLKTRPQHLQKRFIEEWIPMENRYLEHFSIESKADIIL